MDRRIKAFHMSKANKIRREIFVRKIKTKSRKAVIWAIGVLLAFSLLLVFSYLSSDLYICFSALPQVKAVIIYTIILTASNAKSASAVSIIIVNDSNILVSSQSTGKM